MIILAGALVILCVLILGSRHRWWPGNIWPLFVIGMALGLIWEIAFTFLSMGYGIAPGGAAMPEAGDLAESAPLALAAILLIVCIWDGGLFVAGLLLARLLLRRPITDRFDWAALAIMQLWGQLQSFVIEIYAIENGFWAYAPTTLNPALFAWREAWITLWPQLVWFLAMFVFYWIAVRLNRRRSAPVSR